MTRAGWIDTTLGEVTEIISGATPKTSVGEYWDGGIPWVTPKDLSKLDGMFIGKTPRTLSDLGLKSCAASLLPANSVLLSSRAPIGHVAINTVPVATNQGFKSLVPDPSRMEAKFLYWWLRCNRQRIEAMGNGATFKEISKKITASIQIRLPPLEEQKRIASILDAADELRTKRQQAINQLDTLTQAIFHDMFSDSVTGLRWPLTQLGEVCLEKGEYGANVPSVDVIGSEPRYLRITDIRSDGSLNDEVVAPGGSEKDWRSKKLSPGDIVFARSGATVGKTFLMRPEDEPLVFAGYLIRFVPDQKTVLPEFVYQYTRTHMYRQWVKNNVTQFAQPNLNAKNYASLPLPLPPLDLQQRFSKMVTTIRSRGLTVSASEVGMNSLFTSLQQRAFRGDL